MASANVFVPKVSCSCLLPLQEITYQQVGLTQEVGLTLSNYCFCHGSWNL